MAGPRAGAEALVMERLVLRESSFPLPGRGPHGPTAWPGVPVFRACAMPRGDVRL